MRNGDSIAFNLRLECIHQQNSPSPCRDERQGVRQTRRGEIPADERIPVAVLRWRELKPGVRGDVRCPKMFRHNFLRFFQLLHIGVPPVGIASARAEPNQAEHIAERRKKNFQKLLFARVAGIRASATASSRRDGAVGDEHGADRDVEERLPFGEIVVMKISRIHGLFVKKGILVVHDFWGRREETAGQRRLRRKCLFSLSNFYQKKSTSRKRFPRLFGIIFALSAAHAESAEIKERIADSE